MIDQSEWNGQQPINSIFHKNYLKRPQDGLIDILHIKPLYQMTSLQSGFDWVVLILEYSGTSILEHQSPEEMTFLGQ